MIRLEIEGVMSTVLRRVNESGLKDEVALTEPLGFWEPLHATDHVSLFQTKSWCGVRLRRHSDWLESVAGYKTAS